MSRRDRPCSGEAVSAGEARVSPAEAAARGARRVAVSRHPTAGPEMIAATRGPSGALARAAAALHRLAAPCGGQATIEFVGMLPLAVLVALAIGQLLAAGAARELAGAAAEAGAVAIIQGGDPGKAARGAVPGWSADRVDVAVTGRKVRVRLRPIPVIPGLAGPLAATVVADAGPTGPTR